MNKIKYVRLRAYDEIIIFPEIIQHSDFRGWDVKSAGFCNISNGEIRCYGESISLGLKSLEEDSEIATKQIIRREF